MWFVLVAALWTSAADVTDRQTHTVSMADGKALAVDVTIGSVRIQGWDKDEAEITIERRAPTTAGLARIPVTVQDSPSFVRVRGLQEDGGVDADYRADVTIRMPRAALVEHLNVFEGRITLDGLTGSVTATIQRGPIDGRTLSGTLRLDAGIGSVTLASTRLSSNGLLRLRAFNGHVTLALAERPTDARILALALNGHIRSDIPLAMRNTWGPRWGETTLGKGEPVISIDVVTGNVEIRMP